MKPLPNISIIIPTFNSAPLLSVTLQSVIEQKNVNLEIIASDAGSTDHTLEILSSYQNLIRISSVAQYNVYEMINHGISLAKGQYINILFPGDIYIHHHSLSDIIQLAIENDYPHLVYGATLIRNNRSEVKFLFRHFDLELLRKGQQPTSLQACWFRKDVFKEIGKFSTQYTLRSGLEFLCRFSLQHKFKSVSLRRALTEYDLRSITTKSVWRHFKETFKIVFHYFGWIAAMKWLKRQKDFDRLVSLWIRRLRFAFFGE